MIKCSDPGATVAKGEYQHLFVCAVCGGAYYSRPEADEECREEFISRYGHAPEETTDDELVSICDYCNEEFNRRKRLIKRDSDENRNRL